MAAGGEGGERPPLAPGEAEPLLRALAIRLCGNASDANDLVEATLERARLFSARETPRNLRSWLVAILHDLFLDRCRALARGPSLEMPEERRAVAAEPGAAPRPPWSRATIADLREAIEELEPDFRRVYEMHVFEQLCYEEIAARLRIQRVTVGRRLSRARHQLRAILCRRLGEEPAP